MHQVLLAGDADGTKPLGWDTSCSWVSSRAGRRDHRAGLTGESPTPSGEIAEQPAPPPSRLLSIPRAQPSAVGTRARIDLLSLIPAGDKSFVLTLYVLDYGAVGSTTDIWAIPE